jgi:transglutaminase-like putative cysteine protease
VLLIGQPQVETGVQGDEVVQTVVSFSTQEEQIAFLRRVVEQYCGDHRIVSRARDIVFRQRCCAPKDKRCQAIALASWVQENITYVEEIPERFQSPTSTVSQGYGDCDDFVQLLAALLQAVGIEAELVAMQWTEADGTYYRHIFTRAVFFEDGQEVRLPLDATMTGPVRNLVDPIQIAIDAGRMPFKLLVA